MGKSSPPAPPDPYKTASAQTSQNIGTAIANNAMGHVNQQTPDGSLTYSQSGTTQWKDPNSGKVYDIPNYTATTAYSPEQAQIHDVNNQTKLNLANLGQTESAKLGSVLGTPIDLSAANVGKYQDTNMDPLYKSQWDQKQSDLQDHLSQMGVKLGSSAYDRAMRDFGQQRSDAEAINNSKMYGQAVNAIMQEHNQPINEVAALTGGSQVSQPNFVPTPSAQMGTTDIAGLINSNYNQRLGAWQQQNQQQQGMLGGLFGLGGTLGSAAIMASDIRVKKDIRRVGERAGLGVYEFRYKGEPETAPLRKGYMAQEVLNVLPAAVHDLGGVLAVDYSMLPEVS